MADEKFDCIVVGAGPAGIACALTLARAGLSVVILERGEYPGAKNMFGGILYSTILNKLIPEFWKEAPVERYVTKRVFSVLTKDDELSLAFRADDFGIPPYNNNFTVLRAKFDQWFAKKAEDAGAFLLSGVVVDELIKKDGRAIGVKSRLADGDMFADCIVLAEGANSLIAEKMGFKKKPLPEHMITNIKEVLSLPRATIEERFNLQGDEGTAFEYFGMPVRGAVGSGFIYTNKDSISIGLGLAIDVYKKNDFKGSDLLEDFKEHPSVRNLLRGAELKEYSAHMIPEFGYKRLPQLVADGVILIGDTAGLINLNPMYHEGSNLAMASGVYAAETIIEAKKKNDYSAKTLELYREKLDNSFVIKDIKKYRNIPDFGHSNPRFLNEYPALMVELAKDFFKVDETPKAEVQKKIIKKGLSRINLLKLACDLNNARKAMM